MATRSRFLRVLSHAAKAANHRFGPDIAVPTHATVVYAPTHGRLSGPSRARPLPANIARRLGQTAPVNALEIICPVDDTSIRATMCCHTSFTFLTRSRTTRGR